MKILIIFCFVAICFLISPAAVLAKERNYSTEDAMFHHASDMANIGECESDIDCHLRRAINAFSPFIVKYPKNSNVRQAIDEINQQLRMLTWNPKENGLSEIFDLEDTTVLLKNYKSVITKLPDADMRADSFYLLARAFISLGQFEVAKQIYNDLESHYTKYRNAKSRASYLLIDYSQNGKGQVLNTANLTKYTVHLSDTSVRKRLKALDRIKDANIQDRPLLFSLLLAVGNLSEKDVSPIVRRHSIYIIGKLASQTSFFRAAVGYCVIHEPDKRNQYYCADLGINHPDLKSTDFYAYNSERINTIISEATGKKYPSEEQLDEWQNRAIQRDEEVAEELQRRMKEIKERK
ncbi:MAG: hypothetical protein HZB31_07470 [Nitrospirae bacterium]|nr:hypothetical protein [Nitrospirota bacterium]